MTSCCRKPCLYSSPGLLWNSSMPGVINNCLKYSLLSAVQCLARPFTLAFHVQTKDITYLPFRCFKTTVDANPDRPFWEKATRKETVRNKMKLDRCGRSRTNKKQRSFFTSLTGTMGSTVEKMMAIWKPSVRRPPANDICSTCGN